MALVKMALSPFERPCMWCRGANVQTGGAAEHALHANDRSAVRTTQMTAQIAAPK